MYFQYWYINSKERKFGFEQNTYSVKENVQCNTYFFNISVLISPILFKNPIRDISELMGRMIVDPVLHHGTGY